MPDAEHLMEPEAYALGALEPEEMAAGARHLAGCEHCTREVERFAAVAALLPHALDDARAGGAAGNAPRRAPGRWAWGLLAAASLAGLISGGKTAIGGMRDRDMVAAQGAVVRMIAERPMRETPLKPMSPLAGDAHATLMVGRANGMETAVVVSALPPAPPHMTYNLWYERGGEGRPGPQLIPMDGGTAVCVVAGDLAEQYDHVGIVLMGEGKHTMLFSASTAAARSPA
ncbi:MAG: hypothetical protein KGM44_02785 [bacterium]|nr:hypothetical protein [bacterium]